MNIDHLPSEIFDLLSEKPYSVLSSVEKELVAPFMSPEEYSEYQLLIADFKSIDASINISTPPLPVLQNKQSGLHFMFTHRSPIYQLAAGFLLLAVASFIFGLWDNKPLPSGQEHQEIRIFPDAQIGKPQLEDNYPDSVYLPEINTKSTIENY